MIFFKINSVTFIYHGHILQSFISNTQEWHDHEEI